MKYANNIRPSTIATQIQEDETLSHLLGVLKTNNLSEALVFSKKKFKGVFSHFLPITSRQNAESAKIKKYVVPAAIVQANEDLIKIGSYFIDNNLRALPLYLEDSFKKIIDVYGLIELLKDEPELNIENNEVIDELDGVNEDITLGEAIHKIHHDKVKELITKNSEGILTGFISSIELLENYTLQHTSERQHGEIPNEPNKTHQTELKNLKNIPIEKFINPTIPKIKNNIFLSEIAESFSKTKNPFLIVEDSMNNVVGVIKVEKFLKHALETFTKKVENIFFQGLNELDIDDELIKNIHEITARYADKLQHYFNNIFDMKIHLKEYQKEGDKSQFQVFSKLTYPGAVISSEAEDWELITAVRKSLEKLESQLKSKYKDKNITHPEHDYDISR